MQKKRKMGNKGFSLVELLIVIAIMAILVGIMTPQMLKYVDRSRQAKDRQIAETVRTAVVTAMLDPEVTDAPTSLAAADIDTDTFKADTAFAKTFREIAGAETAADIKNKIKDKLSSKAFKGQPILITISGNSVTVKIESKKDGENKLADDIIIE